MDAIDVLFMWDSTGSMFPALARVRRSVDELTKKLFDNIPGIRIACMSHGDYCDGPNFITKLDFADKPSKVCDFIRTAPATGGGDAPEAYEMVLQKARSLNWAAGRNRAIVLIGDDVPHEPGYRSGGFTAPAWENEASLLKEMGVNIYAVQALGRRHADWFYDELAELTGGATLDLDQFDHLSDMLMAICFQRANLLEQLMADSTLLRPELRSSPQMVSTFNVLSGKATRRRARGAKAKSRYSLDAVHPSRFQIMEVDRDCCIKDFVLENGLEFKKGRGFYEFTKTVTIQSYKEVVIRDKNTGEMFSGDKAREILGIPVGRESRMKPGAMEQYRGFIQSTSNNRKLLKGTAFLYEVDGVG